MYSLDFNTPACIHFTGIGGISMSGLAEILLSKGFHISGSDSKRSEITDKLEGMGAVIYLGQRTSNINPDINLLVYTAAVKQDNPELIRARELGIPMLTRAELLGQMMKNYKIAIGVSGTHGKTTTTSMISQILLHDKADPTILVGGILPAIGGNTRIGNSSNFITEACEYTNSFLSFSPTVGVILNVASDHLDFFKDLDDIRTSFKKYAKLIPDDGSLVINSDIDNLSFFTEDLKCKIITYGIQNGDFSAKDISFNEFACGSYTLIFKGKEYGRVNLKVTGMHNIANSLAAIATAYAINISIDTAISGVCEYCGTNRRFQYKGNLCGVTIIDDYAHHPDEIRATLETAQHYPHKTTWCVFQPHTYTRTKALMKDFAQALSLADKVVLADIYAAREKDTLGISSKNLLDELIKLGVDAYYFPSFDEIENFLLKNCINGDLLITMGAGDVVNIGEKLLGI
ncbi:MAG: UDP-N-acetylmuramate--L-alanine ligase [Eubacterium sp.]